MLQLSAVNYEAYQLYFGDTAQATNYDLTVRLSEKTYQLENVTVFAFSDETAFKRAILALDDLPEPEKVVIPGTYQGPRREKKASIGSPISFILDRFSKRAKYERQVQQAQQEATYQKALSKKFNRAMIEEITGLNEERLDEFILFCRLEDRFIQEFERVRHYRGHQQLLPRFSAAELTAAIGFLAPAGLLPPY